MNKLEALPMRSASFLWYKDVFVEKTRTIPGWIRIEKLVKIWYPMEEVRPGR